MVSVDEKRLPEGWRWSSLGDLCEIVIGRTPRRDTPEYWNGQNPWVSISDLNGGIVSVTREGITDSGASESRMRLIPKGTLLFSFKLTIGKMAFAGTDLYINEAIAALFPKDSSKLDNGFLRFALTFIDPSSGSSHAVKGKTLNQDGLRAIEIPLPPLSEQKRIAAILTERLAAVEQARKASEARLEAARALPAAYLREVFESEEAKGWPRFPLFDICEGKGQYGTSSKSNGLGKGAPVLGMKHIQGGRLVFDDLSHVDLPKDEESKYLLEAGDLLFNRTNSTELVGKTAVFESEQRMIFASYLIRFRVRENIADPRFVSAYINSRKGREFVEKKMARAIGQVNISASTMHEMPIPVPPVELQSQLMDEHLARLENINKVTLEIDEAHQSIGALPASLLRQAFSGAL